MEAHVAMTGADEGVILSYRLQLSLDSPRRGRRPLGLLTHVAARSLSLDSQAMTALSNAHLAETLKMVWQYDAQLCCARPGMPSMPMLRRAIQRELDPGPGKRSPQDVSARSARSALPQCPCPDALPGRVSVATAEETQKPANG